MKKDCLQIVIFQKVYNFLILLGTIISYYWGRFMTLAQVKCNYDDKKKIAHRLLKSTINEQYNHIDGDIRCAGTYINDCRGSSQQPNVEFESMDLSTMDWSNFDCLVPIRTLRDISSGEELLVNYGDNFFYENNSMKTVIYLFIFRQLFKKIKLRIQFKKQIL